MNVAGGETRAAAVFVGCKVSQADNDEALAELVAKGLTPAAATAEAEVVVVHTCCVTAEAEHKSRRLVRRLARSGKHVVVAGCAARLHPRQFDTAGVQVLAGDERAGLAAVARAAGFDDEHAGLGDVAGMAALGFERVVGTGSERAAGSGGARAAAAPRDLAHARPAGSAGRRTRVVIKVQDGCAGECSYCAVRLVRGAPSSRPLDDVVRAAEKALGAGCGEVVLSGIDLGAWRDGDLRLPDMVGAVTRCRGFTGESRVRLSSLELRHVDDALLTAVDDPHVARHLHVPLQSADDEVLAAMRRPYGVADFRDMAGRVRERLGGGMLSTDVIVGFPTESEAAFSRTIEAVEDGMFGRVHVFAYSPRPGTEAAALRPLPAAVVKDRMSRALAAAAAAAAAARREALGRRADVLIEDSRGRFARGYSSEFIRYYVPGAWQPGRMVTVVGVAEHEDGLTTAIAGAER